MSTVNESLRESAKQHLEKVLIGDNTALLSALGLTVDQILQMISDSQESAAILFRIAPPQQKLTSSQSKMRIREALLKYNLDAILRNAGFQDVHLLAFANAIAGENLFEQDDVLPAA